MDKACLKDSRLRAESDHAGMDIGNIGDANLAEWSDHVVFLAGDSIFDGFGPRSFHQPNF